MRPSPWASASRRNVVTASDSSKLTDALPSASAIKQRIPVERFGEIAPHARRPGDVLVGVLADDEACASGPCSRGPLEATASAAV